MNRRYFINHLAWGAGLLSASSSQQAQNKVSSSTDQATAPFRLAIHTGMFRRYRGAQAYAKIREAGYRYVELSGGQIRAAANSTQAANRLKQQLSDAGLQAVAAFVVHRIAGTDESDRKRSVIGRFSTGRVVITATRPDTGAVWESTRSWSLMTVFTS